MLARQAEAEEAFVANSDAGPRMELWSRRGPVVVEVSGDMAYTLGFERFNGSIQRRPVEPVTVRVTHVYRREDGEWKIVHRHADNPGPDVRMGGWTPSSE